VLRIELADTHRRTCCACARSYFFELKRTFAPIDPALSLAKVPRSKRHVALKLRKREPGVEWPYLRCGDNDVVLV
jgi:hypothetical protein